MIVRKDKDKDDVWPGEHKDDKDDQSWQFSPPNQQSCVRMVSLFCKFNVKVKFKVKVQ